MKRIASKTYAFDLIPWKSLPIKSKVNLEVSLTCGQAFRWRIFEDDSFVGVFHHRLWQVKLCEQNFFYKVLACPHWRASNDSEKKKRKISHAKCSCCSLEGDLIKDYFRLDEDVEKMKESWIEHDPNLKEALKETGNLILFRQEPAENLITFLCTQNNNVSRIVKMVDKMCSDLGEKLIDLEYEDGVQTFYDFPTLDRLQHDDITDRLRSLGFGYRASYVQKCAQTIHKNGGLKWLETMRDNEPYDEVFKKLQSLPGIGKKVADCVCLMSMDKLEAVPIDTHIRQVALRDYSYKLPSKSLTDKTYNDLGNFFREKWGSSAGWAQTILFARSLPQNIHLYQM